MRNSELQGAAQSAMRQVVQLQLVLFMKKDNVVLEKSQAFAARIIRMDQYLRLQKKENVLTKQALRSGTSIGANISESIRAQSRADFFSKLNIALKEAQETQYWLSALRDGDYLTPVQYKSMDDDCEELIRLLVSITKSQNKDE